jgi:hypothetical protein
MDTITIVCAIDNFYKGFEPRWEQRLTGVIAKTASAARSAVSK